MVVDPAPHAPRFREPHSSLAVGRRFRLLARDPLLGAGIRPRVPTGFRALGRDPEGQSAPDSRYEKQLVVPILGNDRSRDRVWAEARFAADIAAEQALLLSMMLPTETAPDQKKEAQRLHERALKLFQRVDALGPSGVGDPRGFAEDVRSTLQPLIDFEAACETAQAEGRLHGLAWPSLIAHMQGSLANSLAQMDAVSSEARLRLPSEVIAAEGSRAVARVTFVAHLIDPMETSPIGLARALADRLASGLSGTADLDASETLLQAAVDFHTEIARGVEDGRVRSIMTPMFADHLRREALKAQDDLRRSRIAANREQSGN